MSPPRGGWGQLVNMTPVTKNRTLVLKVEKLRPSQRKEHPIR